MIDFQNLRSHYFINFGFVRLLFIFVVIFMIIIFLSILMGRSRKSLQGIYMHGKCEHKKILLMHEMCKHENTPNNYLKTLESNLAMKLAVQQNSGLEKYEKVWADEQSQAIEIQVKASFKLDDELTKMNFKDLRMSSLSDEQSFSLDVPFDDDQSFVHDYLRILNLKHEHDYVEDVLESFDNFEYVKFDYKKALEYECSDEFFTDNVKK